jgi:hypothetical protein
MPNYKRTYKGGGMFFFTLVTHHRRNLFSKTIAREYLRQAITEEKEQHPFALVAIVLLPDRNSGTPYLFQGVQELLGTKHDFPQIFKSNC